MAKESWNKYFLDMLDAVKSRSSCCRRQVGAILTTVSHEIVTTGYNGTPSGIRNCDMGGCARCNSDMPSGQGYDLCLCVHAEMNGIYSASKQGKSIEGSIVYVSDKPCLQCTIALVQCRVSTVYYRSDSVGVISPKERRDYEEMVDRSKISFMEYDPESGLFEASEFYHGDRKWYIQEQENTKRRLS